MCWCCKIGAIFAWIGLFFEKKNFRITRILVYSSSIDCTACKTWRCHFVHFTPNKGLFYRKYSNRGPSSIISPQNGAIKK